MNKHRSDKPNNRHKVLKVFRNNYLYRGYHIRGQYLHHERRMGWEAIDDDGSSFAHGYTLRETIMWIDNEIDILGKNEGKIKNVSEIENPFNA